MCTIFGDVVAVFIKNHFVFQERIKKGSRLSFEAIFRSSNNTQEIKTVFWPSNEHF